MPFILSCLIVVMLSLSSAQAEPANWLYTSDLNDEAQTLLDRSDISGVQTLYTWKSLEPQKDTYDFSAIHHDLNVTTSKDKHLWIQLQDRSFNVANDPVPSYLYHPIYNNGSVPQCDAPDCEEHFIPGGWAAAHWNPYVRVRFQRLLDALAKDLDGKIYGLNLPETAIQVQMNNTQTNFTCQGYFNGELENAKHAANAFNKSYVVQYVNFWPCGWANKNNYLFDSFEFFSQNAIGVGGPDNKPYKKTLENNAYPFMDAYRDKVPISVVAVQEPDLEAVNPNTSRPFTKEEFVVFAEERLGVDVVFWALSSHWLHL